MGVPRELVGLFHPAFSKCYFTTSPTVLFIDHHSCIWRTLVRKPRAAGYDICVAVDGEEAIRLFRLYSIDAVVLDCGLFPPSNVDAVRLSRSLSRDVPLIMTSSYCRAARDRMPAANVCFQKGESEAVRLRTLKAMLCHPEEGGQCRGLMLPRKTSRPGFRAGAFSFSGPVELQLLWSSSHRGFRRPLRRHSAFPAGHR